MHRPRRLILLLLFFMAVSNTAYGQDKTLASDSTLEGILRRGVLRVGFEAGYMPFEMIDKRGGLRQKALIYADVRRGGQQATFVGFDIDMAVEMAKELGVTLTTVNTRWPSIIPALKLGRFDLIMSGMSITAQRQQQVDFSDPYMTIGQTILLNARHKGKVQSYKDLNHARFVITSKPGTTGEAAVQQLMAQSTYLPLDTELACGQAVMEGEADAFVYDKPYQAIFMALYGRGKLIWLDQPFTKEQLAWALRKHDPDFLNWLNAFLKKIRADGRYDRIFNKWFQQTDWHPFVRE